MTIVTSFAVMRYVVDSYIGVNPVSSFALKTASQRTMLTVSEIKCTPVPLGKAQKTQLLVACDHLSTQLFSSFP